MQKKKLFEKCVPDLKTSADKKIVWRGFEVGTAPGNVCKVPGIAEGTVG